VSSPQQPTQYQALVSKCRPEQAARKSVEDQLDGLLKVEKRRQAGDSAAPAEARTSAVERMRVQMREELIPVFAELQAKYQTAGILMELDASDFLSGGVQLAIEVAYDIYGMRLDGTVTPGGIAFHEARFCNDVPGVVTAGPMLPSRNLSGQTFREFICERIGQLVRSVVRRRDGEGI
jgi:hypothetical protein